MKTLTSLVGLHDVYWAIEGRAGRQLWHALQGTSIDVHVRDVEARGGMDGRPGEREYAVEDGIAVVSLVGPMTKATTSMEEGCSTVAARRQIRAAADDPDVRGIMLRIYSPGGSVAGTEALANDVAAVSKRKPTMGFAEDLCCSAALWVQSQCGTTVANPTALVGSIGTYCVVHDYSQMFEMAGVKAHLISTGDNKGSGAMGTQITPEQLTEFRREVTDLNAHFERAMSKGRRMPIADVRKLADGRVWIAAQAKSLGLLDGVGSFDQAMADLRASASGGAKPALRAEDDRYVVALSESLTDAQLFTLPAEALAEATSPPATERETAIAELAETLGIEASDVIPAEPTAATPPTDDRRSNLRRARVRASLPR